MIGTSTASRPGRWASYTRPLQDPGAAPIELNIYYLPGDPEISGRDLEQPHIDALTRVKEAVTVPVAVKLGRQSRCGSTRPAWTGWCSSTASRPTSTPKRSP